MQALSVLKTKKPWHWWVAWKSSKRIYCEINKPLVSQQEKEAAHIYEPLSRLKRHQLDSKKRSMFSRWCEQSWDYGGGKLRGKYAHKVLPLFKSFPVDTGTTDPTMHCLETPSSLACCGPTPVQLPSSPLFPPWGFLDGPLLLWPSSNCCSQGSVLGPSLLSLSMHPYILMSTPLPFNDLHSSQSQAQISLSLCFAF